jgi:hypothetical protein
VSQLEAELRAATEKAAAAEARASAAESRLAEGLGAAAESGVAAQAAQAAVAAAEARLAESEAAAAAAAQRAAAAERAAAAADEAKAEMQKQLAAAEVRDCLSVCLYLLIELPQCLPQGLRPATFWPPFGRSVGPSTRLPAHRFLCVATLREATVGARSPKTPGPCTGKLGIPRGLSVCPNTGLASWTLRFGRAAAANALA